MNRMITGRIQNKFYVIGQEHKAQLHHPMKRLEENRRL